MFKVQNNCFEFNGNIVTVIESRSICKVDSWDNITVNNKFFELQYETQQFILSHELGHIKHRHAHRSNIHHKLYRLQKMIGLAPYEEIQADFHAVKLIGKANALKAIDETIAFFNGAKELRIRRMFVKLFCK